MERRNFLMGTTSMLAGGLVVAGAANAQMKTVPPWVWTAEHGLTGHLVTDPDPSTDDLAKFPRCPYCGMSTTKWSHTRHVIQYEDDRSEATCSVRCLTISLSLNLDRNPKNIWVGDAGADSEIKPLIKIEDAQYTLQPGKMGTMNANRKWAFADKAKAKATGAQLINFEEALVAAYKDQAMDTLMIRKRRAEKRAHMAQKMQVGN
ncbi:nitrous oxide reductase accessory protein NosL [Profundibacter sp.]|uniref:nitrous oxide reductase accessory protein NosL n=1 Tax=Profundibacter sp. TaxID=3101071 RepID=UPI003D0D3558